MYNRLISLLFLFFLFPSPAFAEDLAEPGPTDLIDADELEAFLEPLFADHFSKHRIPGATFAAVQGDQILLARGFGLADVETGDPVLPGHHLFNTGSITKLFTTTAVMQQVERGMLDLDGDVNDYLVDFKVPTRAGYINPTIRVSHLLTHTAGFDESGAGMLAMSPDTVPPLSKLLARNLPNRVRQAGTEYQYSNHGMALAGHLVEVASGENFPDYVAEHIFKPLGMERSAIGRPAELEDDIAQGYAATGDGFRPIPPVALAVTPAGGLNATATDMGRFMIAQLQGGRLGDTRILSEESVETLQRTHFQVHPRISGSALGFYERLQNGLRILEHAGDAPEGFSTLLVIIPEKDFGFFVSYNSGGGAFARFELVDAIVDHYFPIDPPPVAAPPADFVERQDEYLGQYRVNRYIRSGFMRPVGKIVSMYITITTRGDGTLTVHYPGNLVPPDDIVEVAPDLFRHVDADIYVSFERFGDRIGRLNVGRPLVFTAEPVPFHDKATLYVALLAFFQFVFLVGTLAFPLGKLYRKLRKRPSTSSDEKRRQKWLLLGVSALYMLFLVGYGMVTAFQVLGIPVWAYAVFTIPFAAIALSIPMVYMLPRVWRSEEWSLAGRLFYGLLAFAAIAFPPILYWWQLLGYHF